MLHETGSYSLPEARQQMLPERKNRSGEQGAKELTVTYGHDFSRRKTVFTDGSVTKTKIFVPGGYEKITEGPTTKEFYYISTPAGITSVYEKINGTGAMYYVHPDHLGSIHFVTNSAGGTVQELSFDAWGRQRNATNWGYSSLPSPKFERGYTFHEHLSEFDLINMNGRVYDPVVARFLSPDPVLQNPGNLQNYNRYSYVLNNPLKYMDPSGFKHKEWEEFWINPQALSLWKHIGTSGRTMSLYDRLTGERDISYDWITGEYTDEYGNSYTYDEALAYNYDKYGNTNSSEYLSIERLIFSGTKENPYQNLVDVHYVTNQATNGGGNPFRKLFYDPDTHGSSGTLSEWVNRYKGQTFEQVVKEKGVDPEYGIPLGPEFKYVEDPIRPGKYIDITHFLVVAERGRLFGFGVELVQAAGSNTSAFNRQDLWSNKRGYDFRFFIEVRLIRIQHNLLIMLKSILIMDIILYKNDVFKKK